MEIKSIQDVKSFLLNPDLNIRSLMQGVAVVAQTGDYNMTVQITVAVIESLRGMVEFLHDCARVTQESGYREISEKIVYEKNRLSNVYGILHPVCNDVRAGIKDLGDLQSAFEFVVKDLLSIHDVLTSVPSKI